MLLKNNNNEILFKLKTIILTNKYSSKNISTHSVFNHKLFVEIEDILNNMNKNEKNNEISLYNLNECVDKLGRSLREDYNVDESNSTPSTNANQGTLNTINNYTSKITEPLNKKLPS